MTDGCQNVLFLHEVLEMSSREADRLGAREAVLRSLQQCRNLCSEAVKKLPFRFQAGIVNFLERPGVFVHGSHIWVY